MAKKEDLRVRKTKLNLYNGLLRLMETTPFENIKVTDICNESLVNRSTFYDHFNDKYELFNSYIIHLGQSFDEKLNVISSNKSVKDFYVEYLELILDEIESKKSVYKTIFNNSSSSIARDMIIETSVNCYRKFIDMYLDVDDKFAIKYGTLFYASGTESVISSLLEDDSNYDREELIEFFCKLIPDNFKKKK